MDGVLGNSTESGSSARTWASEGLGSSTTIAIAVSGDPLSCTFQHDAACVGGSPETKKRPMRGSRKMEQTVEQFDGMT